MKNSKHFFQISLFFKFLYSKIYKWVDLFIEEQNGQNILRVSKQYLTFIPKMNTLSKLNLIILKGRFGCIEQSISRSC